MLLYDIAAAWRDVAATPGRRGKVGRLSGVLSAASPDEIEIAVALLIGQPRQGRLGVGPAAIRRAWPDHSASTPTLTLTETDAAIERIKGIGGAGIDRRAAQGTARTVRTRHGCRTRVSACAAVR